MQNKMWKLTDKNDGIFKYGTIRSEQNRTAKKKPTTVTMVYVNILIRVSNYGVVHTLEMFDWHIEVDHIT